MLDRLYMLPKVDRYQGFALLNYLEIIKRFGVDICYDPIWRPPRGGGVAKSDHNRYIIHN